MVVDRTEVRLDDQDVIAGAQILAWIALPHRPEHGVDLLNHWFWARRQFRGESVPDLPFTLKKRGRIETQLGHFRQSVLMGIRAGSWFNSKVMSGPNHPPTMANVNVSTRKLASMRAAKYDSEVSNEIRDIWSKRKPIAHLAASFAIVLREKYREEDRRAFDLERTVFNPDWVQETIADSENRLRMAGLVGAFDPQKFHRFHRDSI